MSYSNIDKSSLHFNSKTWTGDGQSTNAITGVGFQPDLAWIKQRDYTRDHHLYDAIRGVTKQIASNTNEAENTKATGLTAFGADGFTLGADSGVNANTGTYVSWNWKANGAGSANTDGSINSTVSVNTTAGFSIVKFTGTGANGTVGHGLGVKPAMIIQKNMSISSAWSVWHKSFSGSQVIYLNETGAVGSNTSSWNSTEPTSSVFSVGTGSYPNGSGNEQIYYVFAEKTGYSKFGSYTGNGSTDGTFVYTGFKPSFILIKNTTSGQAWEMFDNKRDGYNDANRRLYPNASDAEPSASDRIRLVSNGFKAVTSGGTHVNGNGNTHIYMAFGQSLVGSNNVPCTAR